MSDWRLKYNSRFIHADTSAGTAGSSSGVPDNPEVGTANAWVDEFGGRWKITSNLLAGVTGGGGDFNSCYLTRPSGESLGDQRIVGYTGIGGFAANRTFALCLRMTRTATLANSTCYYAEVRTDGSAGIYIYKLAPGASLLAGPVAAAMNTGKYYRIEFQATGTTTTTLRVTVWNLTDGVLVTSTTITDSSSAYQTGRQALDLNTAAEWSRVQTWETYTPTVTGVAAFLGDSLTYGTNASSGAGTTGGTTYPACVMNGLGSVWSGSNLGVSGNTIADMAARVTSDVTPLYDGAKTNVLWLLAGTNDIGVSGSSAATAYSALSSLAATLTGGGWKLVLCTLPPAQNAAYPITFDATRNTYNGLIRSGWVSIAHGIADLALDWRVGQDGCEYDPTYFNGDFTHLTDAGYRIVADWALSAVRVAQTTLGSGGLIGSSCVNGGLISRG